MSTTPDPGLFNNEALAASGAPMPAGAGGGYSVAAMGFSILGGLLKGMAAMQAGNANASTDRYNAHLADLAAGDAILRGHSAAAYALLRGSAMVGKQKSAAVASGVSVSSGSVQDVTSDTQMMSELDAATIRSNATREAWGYATKGTQLRHQADVEESAGRQAMGTSILGGIAGAASYAKPMVPIS